MANHSRRKKCGVTGHLTHGHGRAIIRVNVFKYLIRIRRHTMLENEYGSDYSSWRKRIFDEGYASGLRKGVCTACVRIYRNLSRADKIQQRENLLETDFFQEIHRFHQKYGNISIEHMVRHLLTESEYLIGWLD